jgi:hypothetical protein
MKSWGLYELMRRQAESSSSNVSRSHAKPHWAPGSVEWQAEQEARSKA